MAYQYILDRNTILTTEPEGWVDSKLKIASNDLLKGVYVNYLTTLTFSGDGYDYILAKSVSDGICSVVDIEIVDTLTPDSFHFKGKIFIANTKFNLTECNVECVVEDDSFAQSILRIIKTEVECFGTTVSLNGSVITPVQQNCDLSQVTTAYPTNTVYWDNPTDIAGNHLNTTRMFKLFDVIQYILDYLTNNSVTLQSDFLSTNYLTEKRTYTLGGTVANGDTVSWSYVNAWGVTVTGSVVYDSLGGATSVNTLATQLVGAMRHRIPVSGTVPTSARGITYQGDVLMYINNLGTAANQQYAVIECHYFTPFSITFSTTGSTTFTEAVTQAHQYGGGDLAITNWNCLNGDLLDHSTGRLNISLENIFSNLYRYFNTSVKFYESNGAQYCRIEPIKYFYDQVNNLTVDSFNELKQIFVTDVGLSNLNVRMIEAPIQNFGLFADASYTAESCYDRVLDTNSNWRIGYHHVQNLDFQYLDNNEIIVLQIDGANKINNDWLTSLNPAVNADFITNLNIYYGGFYAMLLSAMPMLHYHVAQNHGYFGNDIYIFNGKTLTITDTIQIQKVYEFKTVLDCVQLDTLLDNISIKINFSDSSGTTISGWIKEGEYDLRSNVLTLSIYSE